MHLRRWEGVGRLGIEPRTRGLKGRTVVLPTRCESRAKRLKAVVEQQEPACGGVPAALLKSVSVEPGRWDLAGGPSPHRTA